MENDLYSLRQSLQGKGLISPPNYRTRFDYYTKYIEPVNLPTRNTLNRSVILSPSTTGNDKKRRMVNRSMDIAPGKKPNFILLQGLITKGHEERAKDYFAKMKGFTTD